MSLISFNISFIGDRSSLDKSVCRNTNDKQCVILLPSFEKMDFDVPFDYSLTGMEN